MAHKLIPSTRHRGLLAALLWAPLWSAAQLIAPPLHTLPSQAKPAPALRAFTPAPLPPTLVLTSPITTPLLQATGPGRPQTIVLTSPVVAPLLQATGPGRPQTIVLTSPVRTPVLQAVGSAPVKMKIATIPGMVKTPMPGPALPPSPSPAASASISGARVPLPVPLPLPIPGQPAAVIR